MKKILTSAISLIISVSFLVGAPVTEKESDKYSLQKEKLARKDKDDSRVKSEDEIWVKIEAKILEVEEDAFLDASKNLDGSPGVIPDSQASILLNALTREEGSGLLSAPEVTVKNGEEAKIQVVQEFVFPTGSLLHKSQVREMVVMSIPTSSRRLVFSCQLLRLYKRTIKLILY